ncbi:MAG: copper chaperone PCu(A)C [Acidobacteria bacterium]|nr:copper chaperone PCu(A)C [Acidobacteriota bacterium]
MNRRRAIFIARRLSGPDFQSMSLSRRDFMRLKLAVAVLFLWASAPAFGDTPWDADYFPNVPLTTHEGESVRFFDLIENKVVAINFIYTICPDTCPLETARMAKVQRLLGDRVGKDIFMYSITIDPENDTPEVLARYAERFGAQPGWTFLTGEDSDITLLRKKLGLYIEEIQDGSNNHNLNLIIGNQATGQWMKRSPFENPYILATQLGSWLSGWKAPPEAELDYADAPKIRQISQGEHLFRTRCSTCHTVGKGSEGLPEGLEGPDLLGVTQRRDRRWLTRWISEPDKMLEEEDPIAMGLYGKYNNLPMPNMRLSQIDVQDVLSYLKSESNRVRMDRARERRRKRSSARRTESAPPESAPPASDAVAVMNAWVREAYPNAPVNAGYMTLVNVGAKDLTLVKMESPAFEKVEIHEMAAVDGLMKMRQLAEVVVPAGGLARFEPGGSHLMLMGPRERLEVGETVRLTLTFRSGEEQEVSVQVADR